MIRPHALCLLLLACGSRTDTSVVAAAEEAEPADDAGLYALQLERLDGSELDGDELRGRTILFVNVASQCGFTPQYEGLQSLWETYRERGLLVVGQPSNQFGGQEPGSADEIASFCRMNYGVDFPLLAKAKVNGQGRTPLYEVLVDSGIGGGTPIRWNFEKFLVSPEGQVVARFPSRTTPDDPELVAAVERHLPAAP